MSNTSPHGTRARYRSKCRCDLCREANTRQKRLERSGRAERVRDMLTEDQKTCVCGKPIPMEGKTGRIPAWCSPDCPTRRKEDRRKYKKESHSPSRRGNVALQEQLPMDPFRNWVRSLYYEAQHEYEANAVKCQNKELGPAREIGALLGCSERRIREWKGEERVWIAWNTVDKATASYGIHITTLYPYAMEIPLAEDKWAPECNRCGIKMRKKAAVCGFCHGQKAEYDEKRKAKA